MKLLRILPLVVGSAVAGILASTSPAHALNWNWSYSGTGIIAAGTFTTTDNPVSGFYTINAITGTRNSTPITALLPPRGFFGFNDNLISQSAPYITNGGFAYSWNSTILNPYSNGSEFIEETGSRTTTPVTFTAAVVPVPFDIPGGATIPTVGSLLGLAAMRKVRKSIASKTSVASPA